MNPSALSRPLQGLARFPALLYGVLLIIVGISIYSLGVVLRFLTALVDPERYLVPALQQMVWYSGVPVVIGHQTSAAVRRRLHRSGMSHGVNTINPGSMGSGPYRHEAV